MKIKRNKSGQMKLSFGMIFSIILIIIFVAFAFFAIKKFLVIGNSAQVAKFTENLQKDIEKVWNSNKVSQPKEYFLPSKIEKVCFADYEGSPSRAERAIYDELEFNYYGDENMFFYPIGASESLESIQIKYIDLEKTTFEKNPLCFENVKGRINLILEKEYGENLVTIRK